ncbi:MAG: hypothetical protein UY70_C0036G0002 [Candidatus Kaiserbacteria bacterium GW2011_GWB1_52_6]|uniref:Uncharacterized protein n=3 Tax=Candidatus Kaiseribacteriota TaxID=1752734 RepID=A0A0G1XFP8_9BACT|nr:MAG: hypothetical protein UY67_C0023G0005 [Candidatus Kaiserbacteria bacterium GW2011_GWA2_52_12]KKW26120.1 MAG: hypothetical protein UY70_C0036G0002 [Candidatus Kaiserbacteria bacterium GW2011_GWB1_52_6]KKW29735.1 MAG: hypothetical protein UY74_C0065G0003 [Candidatus Kaiserbacteria bacterium GW2011_GWC2_52_8b]
MFGSSHERVMAVVDVGSGSGGVAILIVQNDGGPATIVAADRSILPLEDRSKEQTMKGVVSMIKEAGTKVLKQYTESDEGKRLGPPRKVYASIRAPWTRSSAGFASVVFPKEQTITKELITKIARTALEEDHELDKANMLETSVVRVELNEYPTAHPLGKQARRLSAVTFESDFDPVMRKLVTDALHSVFGESEQIMHSGARTYLSIVQERMDHPETYVIIDMVSEATTCMAVRNGIITHHAVLSEGVRTILRRIAGTEGMPEEMLNLMRMVVAGSCSGEACDKLNAALAKIEPDLVRIFGEAIGAFVGKQRLPDTLILAAHPDITAWLSHLFSRIDFAQFTITTRPFVVHVMKPDSLKGSVLPKPGVSIDTGIVVTCAFVNTELHSS